MTLTSDLKQVMQPIRERTTWEEFLHRLWSTVETGPECLDANCDHCIVTPDMFGTGDSPTDYECQAMRAKDCPRLFEDEDDVGRIAERMFNELGDGR